MNNDGGEQNRPCYACQYRRLRCRLDCVFRQYFPPGHEDQFRAVHRLYGTQNFINKVTATSPELRHTTANTIIIESLARTKDLSGGCLRLIDRLLAHIQHSENELETLKAQIGYCRGTVESVMVPSFHQGELEPFPAMINNQNPQELQYDHNYYHPVPPDHDHAQTQINPASFGGLMAQNTLPISTNNNNNNMAEAYYNDLVWRDYEFQQQNFQDYQDNYPPEFSLDPSIQQQQNFQDFQANYRPQLSLGPLIQQQQNFQDFQTNYRPELSLDPQIQQQQNFQDSQDYFRPELSLDPQIQQQQNFQDSQDYFRPELRLDPPVEQQQNHQVQDSTDYQNDGDPHSSVSSSRMSPTPSAELKEDGNSVDREPEPDMKRS